MDVQRDHRFRPVLLLLIAVSGWVAITGQFVLILQHRTAGIPETIIRFFSFFTILTNILVALAATVLLLDRPGRPGRFFSSPRVQTALAIYILVVGLVYNTLLRSIWMPEGLQRGVDELLHLVIPVLFFLYWILYTQRRVLLWKDLPVWLLYPAFYCLYILIRGYFSGFYPYPFIDATRLSALEVARNCSILVGVFLVISLVLIAWGKLSNPVQRI